MEKTFKYLLTVKIIGSKKAIEEAKTGIADLINDGDLAAMGDSFGTNLKTGEVEGVILEAKASIIKNKNEFPNPDAFTDIREWWF